MPGITVVVGDDDDDVDSDCEGSELSSKEDEYEMRYKHIKLLDGPSSHVVVRDVDAQRLLHTLDTVTPFTVVGRQRERKWCLRRR